jgi:exodeoxyribonuclease III
MKVISLNLNGLRSASSKGVFPWLEAQAADIVCAQETRIQADQRDKEASKGMQIAPSGHFAEYVDAQAKGYSGVAIYSKRKPDRYIRGIGVPEFDAEGRWLEAQFGQLSIVSLYLPSGSSGEERQAFKFKSLDWLSAHFARLKKSKREYIICGDWNIAHQNIDIKNWRSNQKNSGFLPEEREWLTALLAQGWIDTHRSIKPDVAEYTWWSNRGNAFANDVGWRIDYQIASPGLLGAAKSATVFREPRFSDHAPLMLEYQRGIFT